MLSAYLCVYILFQARILSSSYALQLDVLRVDDGRPQLRARDCSEVKDPMQAAACRSEHGLERFFGGSKWRLWERVNGRVWRYYVGMPVDGARKRVKLMVDTGGQLTWAGGKALRQASFRYVRPEEPFCEALVSRGSGSVADDGEACEYSINYGGSYYIKGKMVFVNITLLNYDNGNRSETVKNVPMGMGTEGNAKQGLKIADGILGLGRSTGLTFAENAWGFSVPFSYCLPRQGTLGFLQFHTALENPWAHDGFANAIRVEGDHLWYINITEIHVDGKPLDLGRVLAFDDQSQTKGTLVDSGHGSCLVPEAYDRFRDAYASALPPKWGEPHAAGPFETCFGYDLHLLLGKLPNVTFSVGDDNSFTPPLQAHIAYYKTPEDGQEHLCFAYESSDLYAAGAFVLGALTQTNTRFFFHDRASTISWVYGACR